MNSVLKSTPFQCTNDGNVSTTCGGYPRRFDDGQWFMLQRIRRVSKLAKPPSVSGSNPQSSSSAGGDAMRQWRQVTTVA